MIAFVLPDGTIPNRGTPIRVVNDVTGTEIIVVSPLARGDLVESLLWSVARSMRSIDLDGPDTLDPPGALGVVVHIQSEDIVMRFYAIGDPDAALKELEALGIGGSI